MSLCNAKLTCLIDPTRMMDLTKPIVVKEATPKKYASRSTGRNRPTIKRCLCCITMTFHGFEVNEQLALTLELIVKNCPSKSHRSVL